MPDVPIVNSAIVAAPKNYTLPQSQEIMLKAVRADIDGTGAAGSFLPALQLVSNNGDVMWTAVDPNQPVAAGASASVSWFPGVSKASTYDAAAYLWGIHGTVTVPHGGAVHQTYIPWQHFQTTNTAIFGTDTSTTATPPFHNTVGDSIIYGTANGSYLVHLAVTFPAGNYYASALIDNPGSQFDLDQENYETPETFNVAQVTIGADNIGWSPYSNRMFYVDGSTGDMVVRALVTNFDTMTDHNLVSATMGIFFWSGETLALTY